MFKSLELRSTYSTYENDIGAEFYNPVLSESIRYDRAAAYFSAKSLANYSKGLEGFAQKGHKYRLIISTEISEEDYDEIKKGYELRENLKNKLLNSLDEKLSREEEWNLSNLAYLISIGIIDIKMAFTQKGIFHDKFGIMEDKCGNIICFRGSNNETTAAFHANYEAFDITCSWQASTFDYSKITKSIGMFETLWNNKATSIYVCNMDKVIKEKILSYSKGKIILEPIFIQDNCLILDYNKTLLKLEIKIQPNLVWNNSVYKLKIKRFVDIKLCSNTEIIFDKNLTYPKFKHIISILEKDSNKRGYNFYVTNRLKEYISSREMYIEKRAKAGLAIKCQDISVIERFNRYKNIVDSCMIRELRHKQMWDSFYMCTMKKAGNFSVPGSGKTASVLGVYAYLNKESLVNKLVMIGPKNSFGSWIDEFNKCFGQKKELKVFNVQDYKSIRDKKNGIIYDTGSKNLLLFNYESLGTSLSDIKKIIDSKTMLIFDEVHKVKAIGGIRAENALELSKNSHYTIAMTGTPIPNSYVDIRNILEILYHDEYDEFFGFDINQLIRPSLDEIDEINNKIQPFFCRTTKRQLNVPESNDDIISRSYASLEESKIFQILLLKYAKNKLSLIIRLLQLESNPKMLLKSIYCNGEDFSEILDTSGNIEDIDFKDYSNEIIDLINSVHFTKKFVACVEQATYLYRKNKPLIIWCIFIDSILRVKEELELRGIRVGCIYGATENSEREAVLNAFKIGKLDVLITNPHTLAESISLHGICHDAIYFEYSYNLVHLLQSKDRIHRLGLQKDQYTQYYFIQNEFLTKDGGSYSLDEKIFLRLQEKEQIMIKAIENNTLESVTTVEEDLDIIFKNLKL